MRVRWALGVATLVAGLALSGAPARADDDAKSELDALKKRVAELEDKQEAKDDSLRQAAERISGPTGPNDFRVYWNDGLKFETADKGFTLHIGGRMQYDAEWFHTGANMQKYPAPPVPKTVTAATSRLGNQADGDELRRLRLQFDGTIYQNMFYKMEFDLAHKIGVGSVSSKTSAGTVTSVSTSGGTTDDVQIRSAYIGTTALQPFANLQVGHFDEPFNLETLTSDNFITFMERAPTFALSPEYQTGIQFSNAILDQRMTWAIGEFRTQNGSSGSASDDQAFTQADSGYNTTARVTGLPWYQDEKTGDTYGLLHLGASASQRYPTKATSLAFAYVPEMHMASKFVNTGAIANVHEYQLYNEEIAFVYGPFSAQGEWNQANITRTAGSKDLMFNAVYGYISYFLTGEHRGYSKANGWFDRVRPKANFGKMKDGTRGWGAWELAARYSYIDLTDHDIYGGRMADVTVGLNWYLNPNMRIMLNYVRSQLLDCNVAGASKTAKGGDEDILGIRFQLDL
jgi:phosphate-selective porin OprO and OprP